MTTNLSGPTHEQHSGIVQWQDAELWTQKRRFESCARIPPKRTVRRSPKRTRTGLPARGGIRLPCFLGHCSLKTWRQPAGTSGKVCPKFPPLSFQRGQMDKHLTVNQDDGATSPRFSYSAAFGPPAISPRDATGVAAPLSMGREGFDSPTRRSIVLGRRVMVTSRASKTRREGSIPSRPALGSFRGRRSTVGPQSSKTRRCRVRFPLPALVSSRISDEERSLQNCVGGFDSLSALRPARSTDEHSPSKRAYPGSNPGRGTLLSLTCRKQAPVYEAGCRGSTPRREANLGVAQPGESARFGTERLRVRISPPRPTRGSSSGDGSCLKTGPGEFDPLAPYHAPRVMTGWLP